MRCPFVVLSVLSTGSEIWGLEYLAHAVGLRDHVHAVRHLAGRDGA